jgi:hypothetical protein
VQEQLLEMLERRGWSVTRHSAELEWWADEIWAVESIWSPSGFTLYLTFLNDPQPGSQEPFLAVGTCPHWPQNMDEAGEDPYIAFYGWVQALPQFVDDLDRLRKP